MKKTLFGTLAVLITVCMLLTDSKFAYARNLGMSVKIQNTKRTVAVGGKLKLNAKILRRKKGAKLVYSSSNKKIATVSAKGVIYGKKPGKTKIKVMIKGKRIKKVITITVKKKPVSKTKPSAKPQISDKPHPTGMPQSTDMPQASGNPHMSVSPEPTDSPQVSGSPEPTDSPQVSGSPEPTDKPQVSGSPEPTDKPQISGSPKPTDNPQASTVPSPSPAQDENDGNSDVKLILYQGVMDIDGEKMTVYLVNKTYKGKVRFNVNGKEFSYSGNAGEMLKLLANSGTTITNSEGTIRLSRKLDKNLKLAEYWTIEDIKEGKTFEFKAKTDNTVMPEISDCGILLFKGDVTSVITVY